MVRGLSSERFQEIKDKKELNVAVYGLGRVGLPLAAAWLRSGNRVIGADIQEDKVDKINQGISPILDEPGIPEAVEAYVRKGLLRATTDLVMASEVSDVKFVTVPTTNKKCFDRESLESALRAIGKGLREGGAISIECSVPPTTTDKWAKPILEEESGLKAERDFALIFSPERIFEGRALEDLEERYPKIVGGVGPNSAELFVSLYSRVAKKGAIAMSGATEAELSKLFEGVYRDVNIALANELSKLCEAMNVEFAEIREASNSQPFCHLHRPGIGVGGACIPIYPYFVLEKAEENNLSMPLTKTARAVNEDMPRHTVGICKNALAAIGKSLQDVKIAILGLAYRADISDPRNSPTYDLIEVLGGDGSRIVVHDPIIKEDKPLKDWGVKLVDSLHEALKGVSLVIIATAHAPYREIDVKEIAGILDLPAVVMDGGNIVKAHAIPKGIYLTGLGRKTIKKYNQNA